MTLRAQSTGKLAQGDTQPVEIPQHQFEILFMKDLGVLEFTKGVREQLASASTWLIEHDRMPQRILCSPRNAPLAQVLGQWLGGVACDSTFEIADHFFESTLNGKPPRPHLRRRSTKEKTIEGIRHAFREGVTRVLVFTSEPEAGASFFTSEYDATMRLLYFQVVYVLLNSRKQFVLGGTGPLHPHDMPVVVGSGAIRP